MKQIELIKWRHRLESERASLLPYLTAKFNNKDFHGVQDAASDLRDIDCQLEVLDAVLEEKPRIATYFDDSGIEIGSSK